MASPSIDEHLARHDEVLRQYRKKFEEHRQWLQGQRETPSFVHTQLGGAAEDDTASSLESGETGEVLGGGGGPGKPVHEQLLEKGKLYQQRKEALREEAIRREIGQMQPKPKISAAGRAKQHADPTVPIYERFAQREERRQQDLEKARQQSTQEQPKFPFKPNITRKARRAASRVHDSTGGGKGSGRGGGGDAWSSRRNQRLDEMRNRQWLEQLSELRDSPCINVRSERLVQRRREREEAVHGAARGPHFTHADSLLERDRLSKLQLWEKYQQQTAERQPGNPKITPYAAGLDRSHLGSACERLYDASFDREERRSALLTSGSAAECYHSPRITAHAASIRRNLPVEDDLMERAERSRGRRDESMRAILQRERDLHRPVINPVSDEIAARLPLTARERLYTGRADYSTLSQSQVYRAETPTAGRRRGRARGSGGRRSRSAPDGGRLAAPAVSGDDSDNSFYRRGERRREQADKRLEHLRRAQEQKAMEECTFQPMTHVSGQRQSDSLPVHERSAMWHRRREEKLDEERAKREGEELADCTFTPNKYRPAELPAALPVEEEQPWKADPETQLYGGDGHAWGFEEFVERHREARRRLMEKQDAAFAQGKGWRNEITVPQEFNLGRRDKDRARVDALRKPLSPPRAQGGRSPARSAQPHEQQQQLQPGLFSNLGSAAILDAAVPAPQHGAQPWQWGEQPPAAYPAPDSSSWQRRM